MGGFMTQEEKNGNRLDWILNKLLPKKFLVFTIATVALFMSLLPGELWGYIAMFYIGGNALAKFAEAMKK